MHVPYLLDTDSYKLSHPEMYPKSKKLSAYFSFRKGLPGSEGRVVFYGMRWMYDQVLSRRVTMDDIRAMENFAVNHMAGGQKFNWPRELWLKVVNEREGYLPFRVRALREGQAVLAKTPCFIIEAEDEFAPLVTWLETQLMRVWSESTTATKSRIAYENLEEYFKMTVDEVEHWRLAYALHDFGSRGVSSQETAIRAGMGHLIVFDGTDNIAAAAYLRRQGNQAGQSVIASEHSVMTSWDNEEQALQRLIDMTPEGAVLSCVADSYDYKYFATEIVPKFRNQLKAKSIHFVLRPDSGDPVEAVMLGLRAMDKCFGHVVNSKGYKVIQGASVIQGDGIDLEIMKKIMMAVERAGYSAQCVIYGMGGGLLQKQTRDSMSAAIKLCERIDTEGVAHDIMKAPKTDTSKYSLPGNMSVRYTMLEGPWGAKRKIPVVYPQDDGEDMLEVIWDNGPVEYYWDSLEMVRARARETWKKLLGVNPSWYLSNAMKQKITKLTRYQR